MSNWKLSIFSDKCLWPISFISFLTFAPPPRSFIDSRPVLCHTELQIFGEITLLI